MQAKKWIRSAANHLPSRKLIFDPRDSTALLSRRREVTGEWTGNSS